MSLSPLCSLCVSVADAAMEPDHIWFRKSLRIEHHSSLDALLQSSSSCHLCHLLWDVFVRYLGRLDMDNEQSQACTRFYFQKKQDRYERFPTLSAYTNLFSDENYDGYLCRFSTSLFEGSYESCHRALSLNLHWLHRVMHGCSFS